MCKYATAHYINWWLYNYFLIWKMLILTIFAKRSLTFLLFSQQFRFPCSWNTMFFLQQIKHDHMQHSGCEPALSGVKVHRPPRPSPYEQAVLQKHCTSYLNIVLVLYFPVFYRFTSLSTNVQTKLHLLEFLLVVNCLTEKYWKSNHYRAALSGSFDHLLKMFAFKLNTETS